MFIHLAIIVHCFLFSAPPENITVICQLMAHSGIVHLEEVLLALRLREGLLCAGAGATSVDSGDAARNLI